MRRTPLVMLIVGPVLAAVGWWWVNGIRDALAIAQLRALAEGGPVPDAPMALGFGWALVSVGALLVVAGVLAIALRR